jgi:peptide subunit release factor 1 (eRF1)
VAEKIVDVMRLDINTPEHEVFRETLESIREHDAKTDAEKVERLLEQYRGGGLAVVGVKPTLRALANGQVDELLLSGGIEQLHEEEEEVEEYLAPTAAGNGRQGELGEKRRVHLPDALVTQARQTGAAVSIIEDPKLLERFGGVGAFLRFRIQRREPRKAA